MEMERKEQPEKQTQPAFRLWLCGPFALQRRVGDQFVPVKASEWVGRSDARSVLKVLARAPGRQMRRETLQALLWPDADPEQTTQTLTKAISVLRRVLAEVFEEEDGRRYRLAGQDVFWVDVEEALTVLQDAEQKGRTTIDALNDLEKAAAFFNRGPFLEEEEDEWAISRQATIERARYRCLLWLAEACEHQGRDGQAETTLQTLRESDPFDEDVLSRLLLVHCKQGMIHQALRLAEQINVQFAEEGIELSKEMRQTIHRLKEMPRPSLLGALESARAAPEQRGLPTHEDHRLTVSPLVPFFPLEMHSPDWAAWFGLQSSQVMALIDRYCGQMASSDATLALLSTCGEMLKMFDRPPEQERSGDYALSRRQALITLATGALALLAARGWEKRSFQFSEGFLARCAAGLLACRSLMKGNNFALAEHILTQYQPVLETLMQEPSPYQQTAASLALQCDGSLRILASHRLQWDEAERHSQHAIRFSPLAKDQHLRMVVLIGHASDYFNRLRSSIHEPRLELEMLPAYEQAFPLINQVSPLLRSNFYIKRAAAFAQQGHEQQARTDLDQARDHFPQRPESDPGFLSADFGFSSLLLWEGFTFLELARLGFTSSQEAWDALARVEHLDTTQIMSERNRIEVINYQAQAALLLKDLDLFCAYLPIGIQGAQRLKSARRLNEATENYWLARKLWPREERVREMAELFLTQEQGMGG